jgi:hypothetical protein
MATRDKQVTTRLNRSSIEPALAAQGPVRRFDNRPEKSQLSTILQSPPHVGLCDSTYLLSNRLQGKTVAGGLP